MRHSCPWMAIALLAVASVGARPSPPPRRQASLLSELEGARREIGQLTMRIRKLGEEQGSLSREVQLREAERQLAQSRLVESLALERDAVRRQRSAEVLADHARDRLEEQRVVLASRVRVAARVGPPSLLRTALVYDSADRLYWGWQTLAYLVKRGARAATSYERLARQSARFSSEELERAQVARAAGEEAALRREQAKVARDQARDLLAGILAEREQQERLLAEEVARAQRLEELLRKLGVDAEPALPTPGGESILTQKGLLPWPTTGPIKRGFGRHRHPKFGTITVSQGIEIDAPKGSMVRVVFAGRVVFADWFTGYGNLVILDHGDKVYSLYAHMDDVGVKVGDRVVSGAAVGTVSDTGSVTGPGLYFEIRRGAQAVNPLEWVGKR